MKTIFTFSLLPVIVLIGALSGVLYIRGEMFGAYSLVLASFASTVLWIRQVGLLLDRR